MRCGIAFDEKYYNISFTPESLSSNWTERVKIFMNIYERVKDRIKLIRVKKISEDLLLLVHSKEYIERVKRDGTGYLDYGDTRSYPGVFEDALLAVSGTITLVNEAVNGSIDVGFNPQGGFHHAKTNSVSGFCVFNDVALVARYLQRREFKVVIVDIDGHHGDGTQWILYKDKILKVSFHMYSPGFYPGTGYTDELGEGYGYSINIPLPPGTGDDMFLYSLNELVIPLLESYRPSFLILQMGVDGHYGDPLVGLRLTTKSYDEFSTKMYEIAEKYKSKIIGLGGGYLPDVVARTWMLMLINLAGIGDSIKDELRDKREGTESNSEIKREVKRRIEWLKGKVL